MSQKFSPAGKGRGRERQEKSPPSAQSKGLRGKGGRGRCRKTESPTPTHPSAGTKPTLSQGLYPLRAPGNRCQTGGKLPPRFSPTFQGGVEKQKPKREFSINFSRLKSTGKDCADPFLHTFSVGTPQSPPPPTRSQGFRNYTRIFLGSGSFTRVVKPRGAQVTTQTLSTAGTQPSARVGTGVPAQTPAGPGAPAPELETPPDPRTPTPTLGRSTRGVPRVPEATPGRGSVRLPLGHQQ